MTRRKLIFQRILPITLAVVLLGTVLYGFLVPAIGALACPSCFGLERIASRVIVDQQMPEAQRHAMRGAIRTASDTVQSFYGKLSRKPYVLICASRECDQRLGAGGVNALTISGPFFTVVRVSSNGREVGFLAHEFSHVELHKRVGINNLGERVPAWFDEGLAVVVAGDRRFIRPGTTYQQRCIGNGNRALPAEPSDWIAAALRQPMIYADAGCKVLRWMERHGGRQGALQAIAQVASGGRIPD